MHKKPRLSVKSMSDATQQLRAALGRVDALQLDYAKAVQAKEDEWTLRRRAETDAKAARAEHDDLKQKLYNSEIELARLRGFVERVREDDAVRDPLVDVEDGMGKRQVTKRFPTNAQQPCYGNGPALGAEMNYGGINREKPKHWTSY